MSIIKRPLLEKLLTRKTGRLLYGRRKTGKTFYTRLTLEPQGYSYWIIRRGGSFYDPGEDYETSLQGFLRECRKGGKYIIDEFHRAPTRLLDTIHAGECNPENIVLVTSTLHYYRKLLEEREAPLLGFYTSIKVPLVSPRDIMASPLARSLLKEGDRIEAVKTLVFYQEPSWINKNLKDVIIGGYDFTLGLAGEILNEEDYTYTERMHSILEAVAAGKTRLTEIAGYLYNRGLLPRPETGLITKYLELAVRLGLLERIPVYPRRRKRSIYRHYSPVTWLSLYLQARYGFYDLPIDLSRGRRLSENILPFLFEVFVERLLADVYSLQPARMFDPEIDLLLLRNRRPVIAGEVKMKRRIPSGELSAIEEKLYRVRVEERVLVVPDKTGLGGETGLRVLDLEDLARMSLESQTRVEG